MQFVVVFLLLFGLGSSAPHEGLPLLNPGGIGGIFKGPGSETIIIGPDGSEITSEQKGGVVIRDDSLDVKPIVVAEPEIAPVPAPIIPAPAPAPILVSTGAPLLASAAPILPSSPAQLLTGETYERIEPKYLEAPIAVSAAPILPLAASIAPVDFKPIEIVEQDPHIIETEIIEAPDVEPEQSSDLKGPSGRIITKGSASVVSGPASTTITEPRKIIIAPPKIAVGTPVIATATIPLKETPLLAPLPVVTASTVAPLPAVSFAASSTIAPPVLSSTFAPLDLGYSTAGAPLIALSSTLGPDTSRIDLGVGAIRESIPVIEYSSSNGVLNGQNLAALALVSSTEAPIVSSTFTTVVRDKFAPPVGPAVPSAYLTAPVAPASNPASRVSASPNIQKIPRLEDNISVEGRVDMGYYSYNKRNPQPYRLPQVLGMALSSIYHKNPVDDKNRVIIDDKMGELTQNEIAYEPRPRFLPPPDLSQSKYIGPALVRNGIDSTQVNLEPVPISQVTRLPDGGYQLTNRYERQAKRRF